MDDLVDSVAFYGRLVVAGIFGMLAFSFGGFFWIMMENHPEEHPVFTVVLGVAFAVSAITMVAMLMSLFIRPKSVN